MVLLTEDSEYKPVDQIMIIRHNQNKDDHLTDEGWENLRSISYESKVLFLVSNYQ